TRPPRCRRRRPLPVALRPHLLPQRPHRPADVGAVQPEARPGLRHPPALREPLGLAHLAAVAVPVGPAGPPHQPGADQPGTAHPNAAARPARVPNTSRAPTVTTRPFSRVAWAVAYTSHPGAPPQGQQ